MATSTYKPLSTTDSIRVLSLLPGRPDDGLCARLSEVRLAEEPAFTALSYRWGDPVLDNILECDGYPFAITKSLATALTTLRGTTEILFIWVDQVCINQKDVSERKIQVMLMGQIYSRASKVFIWLGDEREGDVTRRQHHRLVERFLSWIDEEEEGDVTSSRLQTLVERLSRAQQRRDENGDTRNTHQLQSWGLEEYELPKMGDVGYKAILRLLGREYLSRGWILQEAVLAKKSTLHVGTASFEFMDFLRALMCCQSLGFEVKSGADSAMRLISIAAMRIARSKNQREELLTLLLRTRTTTTTDPKDKIYCLLGLSEDANALKIVPDYHDETSVEDVYREFAFRNISLHGHLDVLSTPRAEGQTSLPSWVPDWRLRPRTMMLSLTGRDQHQIAGQINPYHATGCSKASITVSEDPAIVGLTGMRIDIVEECGRADQGRDIEAGLLGAFNFAVNLRLKYLNWKCVALLHTWRPYVTGGTREDAFWRCLIAGHPLDLEANFLAIRNQYRAWSRQFFLHAMLRRWLPDAVLVPLLFARIVLTGLRTFFALCCFLPFYGRNHQEEAFHALLTCLPKRVIIRTKKGYIGLAPESTREGDEVTLLEGGRLPFILRKQDDHWLIIGDCYIHGLMESEAYDPEECKTMWIR